MSTKHARVDCGVAKTSPSCRCVITSSTLHLLSVFPQDLASPKEDLDDSENTVTKFHNVGCDTACSMVSSVSFLQPMLPKPCAHRGGGGSCSPNHVSALLLISLVLATLMGEGKFNFAMLLFEGAQNGTAALLSKDWDIFMLTENSCFLCRDGVCTKKGAGKASCSKSKCLSVPMQTPTCETCFPKLFFHGKHCIGCQGTQ